MAAPVNRFQHDTLHISINSLQIKPFTSDSRLDSAGISNQGHQVFGTPLQHLLVEPAYGMGLKVL